MQGINCYLEFIGKSDLKTQFIKIQQKTFLENVISNADYEYFKSSLKKDNELFWYFVIRFLGATGARISEVIKLDVTSVKNGYMETISKGSKFRRIYIPKDFQNELMKYIDDKHIEDKLFNITPRGISNMLKKIAEELNIDLKKVHPHSFRHMFAINFLKDNKDITLLADLLGHSNLDTTKIYLRRTEEEQRKIINNINW